MSPIIAVGPRDRSAKQSREHRYEVVVRGEERHKLGGDPAPVLNRSADRSRRARGAGLGATIILTICTFIKSAAGMVPEANPIQALVKVSTLWLGSPLVPWVGWLEHFFIGTVAWGTAYAIIEPMLPSVSWIRGILFAIGAWILMMVLSLPLAGGGWFGAALGIGVPLSALVLHIIYGFCLGGFYDALGRRQQQTPAAAETYTGSKTQPAGRR